MVFAGPIEVDEVCIGGADNWKHKAQRRRFDKTPVVGLRDRATGQVRAKVVPDPSGRQLRPFTGAHSQPGARMFTDEWGGYHGTPNHETVNHSGGEYVRGDVHRNGIAGFWSHLKRQIRRTHVGVSPKHVQRGLTSLTNQRSSSDTR